MSQQEARSVRTTGRIEQLNVSPGGVPKRAVTEGVVNEYGLTRDRQRDRRHHGGTERAVCLFSAEILDSLRADGHQIGPAQPVKMSPSAASTGRSWCLVPEFTWANRSSSRSPRTQRPAASFRTASKAAISTSSTRQPIQAVLGCTHASCGRARCIPAMMSRWRSTPPPTAAPGCNQRPLAGVRRRVDPSLSNP